MIYLNRVIEFVKLYIILLLIFLAIHGKGFCKSGEQAFKILSSNALRVAAINSVGDFVLFLGKAFVVSATVLIGIELIQVKILKILNFLVSLIDKS